MWHDSFIHVTWLIPMWHDSFLCDMTHSYVTWLIPIWREIDKKWVIFADKELAVSSYVTWLIPMWHDSFLCDMAHSYMTWLISIWHFFFLCDMTHSHVTWLIPIWRDWFLCDMFFSGKLQADTGWPRLIGCLKLQVIFRKRAINYRHLYRHLDDSILSI